VFLPMFIISFGMGNAFGPVTSTALVGVQDHDAGVASALVNADQQIGGSIGLALLNTIAITATASYLTGHHTSAADPHGQMAAVVHGYTTAFAVATGLMVLAALVGFIFIRVRPEQLQGSGIPGAS
jgi:hypothetical protein